MFLLRLLVTIMSIFLPCSGENGLQHAYSPGDIIIGGLFPLHLTTNRSAIPGPLSCSNYDISGFLHTQVMIYTIGQINQRTPRLLPNLTLGYDIYDTCGDVNFAITATLELFKRTKTSTLSEPKTKAVIGERFSEVSVAVARIAALSSLAQISYSSTSEVLSNKNKFPTFLRTTSSDECQTKAIAELVNKFNWKTVAIIGSNDEYGKHGTDSLGKLFNDNNICIEFVTILPDDFSQNNSQASNAAHLAKLVKRIKESFAEAIIMFTKITNVDVVMDAAIKYKLNRTWIASDSWSTSTKVSEMTDIVLAGQVFGFISKRNEVPGFKQYVTSMFDGTQNSFIEDFKTRTDCKRKCFPTTECLNLSCLVSYIDQDKSYNTYIAVQVVAEAIRNLLNCDNQRCQRGSNFSTTELLMAIKKVNFTVNATHMSFDANGDTSLGYDILYWNMTESTQHTVITTIGEYSPDGKINITVDLITDMPVTLYNCSKTCKPGQQLRLHDKKCCRHCIPCADGEFSPGNGEDCKACNQRSYSSPERDKCLEKTDDFLQWLDPCSITLTSFGILGIIVTIVFVVLFIIYRSTPIVKAVGGYLCFLELFSLLTCFCLTFTFIGRPTKTSCMAGLPVFGIAFSLCISCILANLLQILVGFSFDLEMGSWIKKLNHPVPLVTFVSGIQLALCVPWLCYNPPFPEEEILINTILHECETGSTAFFIAMIGYNAFLALICFGFAFKGKRLPDLYKNASLITISMLVYLIIWVLFIQIYINNFGKYKPAIESGAILISSYSILCCHLAPKCYIMVFRKEINNENVITEYIRKHYEQKGMTVVK
ncbi:G-protein coupled receptor family C group 6 member A-like isoform X1 [Anabas testudineus]|uniref:G-protein coupled receptor family C group 6 member A-like isoform X1 n=2 Tax=Anabas testudineus TaxID=64144 RepID=UPI000E465058|nr:G-protein coupled receptor family C group 6 member A-like isoform X1 [Anabas testudineus]